MATITSVGSGLWSVAGTWDAGVPVDNDVVVIASGHVVEFDVDQSGFANGIDGITVTGTLSLTRTSGTYQLKVKAAKTIAGAGTFDCGTSGSPIPFAAKHTITGGTGWGVVGTGGLVFTCYAAEPAITYVKLSGSEAVGQTVLEVDTDITSDIWADGDTICIVDPSKDTEIRVIAAGGRAAGAITVTVGLTAAKDAGAYVILMNRNVKFTSTGTSVGYMTSPTIAGGEYFSSASRPFTNFTGGTISGGTMRGGGSPQSAIAILTGVSITGGAFLSGGTVVSAAVGVSISGGIIFSGNIGFSGSGTITGGLIVGNTTGIADSSVVINGGTIRWNTNDIRSSVVTAYNTLFESATENALYTNLAREIYSQSVDHDQVPGAFKAWTKGGVTTKQSTTYPTGYTYSMQTVLENATSEGFWQKEYTVGAGESISFDFWLRKSASMTYLPRIILFNKASTDPFAGGAGINTFTMTNSVDTWENSTYVYTNSGSVDVTIIARTLGMNASGNVFSVVKGQTINVDLTALTAAVAVVDTVVDAVKAKTDSLTFTVAGQVDSNVQSINDTELKGDGSATPWGPV